jgi:hypothetical protein
MFFLVLNFTHFAIFVGKNGKNQEKKNTKKIANFLKSQI